MSFINFFWRDFKSDHSFNRFYILCASLGIIGLLLVESFRFGIEDKISRNAKNFIASDLSLSTRRSLSEKEITGIEAYLSEKKIIYAKWTETYSLVSKDEGPGGLARLADLNFVTPEFPFYGGVTLEDKTIKGPGAWGDLHSSPRAWVSRDLAWELNLHVRDKIKIGEAHFEVSGLISQDQFTSFRGFSLAPKIFVSYNFMKETDLIKFGSTATYSYNMKLPLESLRKKAQSDLRNIIPDKSVKIVGAAESSQQISRSLNILTDYLSLITLMTYLLSLVGLYYFSQHFLSKKIKTFSIYKALGIKNSFLFKVNFFHLIVLILISVIISTGLVTGVLPYAESFFSRLTGESLSFILNLKSVLRILLLSLGGSLLALGPLFWGALQTPVATIFQDLPAELKRIRFYYFLPLAFYVILLTVLLANSFKVGGIFLGSLILIISSSAFFFKAITSVFDKISKKLNFTNRHAVKTLSRYFVSSFTIFICLLLGMTLTTFIFQLESSIREEFIQTHEGRRPDLFAFDMQEHQAKEFNEIVTKEKWKLTMFSPMIRARLIKINDKLIQKKEEVAESTFATREEESEERIRNRAVNLSYRSKLSWAEKITEGHFEGSVCDPSKKLCSLSIEESYARRLGAKLGDKLTFDVSDIEVEGVLTSFRKVKWTSFEPNFFILFQPGVIDEAPKTYLSSIKVNSIKEKQIVFRRMAETFPNVSLLEVSEIVRKIVTIFDLMAIAIKFISILSLLVALIVLTAVSFNHLDLRKREMTLFHMMGLKPSRIKSIYSREFGILILLCLFLSLIFGTLLTFAMMKFVFNSEAILRLQIVIPTLASVGVVLYIIVSFRIRELIKTKSLF